MEKKNTEEEQRKPRRSGRRAASHRCSSRFGITMREPDGTSAASSGHIYFELYYFSLVSFFFPHLHHFLPERFLVYNQEPFAAVASGAIAAAVFFIEK